MSPDGFLRLFEGDYHGTNTILLEITFFGDNILKEREFQLEFEGEIALDSEGLILES